MERYLRQIELLGKDNQDKLKNSKVLVIGTGGLGSPTLIALTVAGIGEIGLRITSYNVCYTKLLRMS